MDVGILNLISQHPEMGKRLSEAARTLSYYAAGQTQLENQFQLKN